MAPTTTAQWQVTGKTFDDLKYTESVEIPKLGDHDVLVQWKYASLNFRDLIIAKGTYPFAMKNNVVPGSDGAGVVAAIGAKVTDWKEGDEVLTLFHQAHQYGPARPKVIPTAVGGMVDGALRQYGVHDQTGLVANPKSLSLQEGSTLTCAAVTAWNALYGIESRALKAGDWVLTQGTGGVSIFALQFAKAAGAQVIATTSSPEKAKKLKELGADVVINYKETPKWGEQAKKEAHGGQGVDFVVEVGGPATMEQSLVAIRSEGIIGVIGFIAGKAEKEPSFEQTLLRNCIVRGIFIGPRSLFEAMNDAIDANKIKPVIDDKVFDLKDLKEAYQYMWDQKHFGKLTIKIS